MAAFDLLYNVNLRKKRVFRFKSYDYTEDEIMQRFRFSPEGIDYISKILDPYLRRETQRNRALSVQTQVQKALRYFASGSHLRVVGDALGYDISTDSRTVRDVSDALCRIGLAYICWPSDSERREIRDGFFGIAGFPGVMGAIDCTHVRIQGPSEYENNYINRKGFHSINVQAVCDHRGKFLNLLAKWPGSCHDSFILRTSDLAAKMESEHRGFDIDGVLLGDSGYACGKYLVTPYARPSNISQNKYNQAHTKTRAVIERCFGWWKRRFAVLHSEIRMHPERVIKVINACGVLHNIAFHLKEPMQGDPIEEEEIQPEEEDAAGVRHVRDFITNNYFN